MIPTQHRCSEANAVRISVVKTFIFLRIEEGLCRNAQFYRELTNQFGLVEMSDIYVNSVEAYIICDYCRPVGGSMVNPVRRVELMTQILVLGVLGKAIGTDGRLNSVVELLDVASFRKRSRLPSRCPSAWRAVLRTEPDNRKYMTGSKQLLKAENKSITSLVRSNSCK